jgi:hypothetical protein
MGVLYVLDEPSIGLHQRDNARLIQTLKGMRDLGNTCWSWSMTKKRCARRLADRPGTGAGKTAASGRRRDALRGRQVEGKSLTGAYLSGRCASRAQETPRGQRRKAHRRGARRTTSRTSMSHSAGQADLHHRRQRQRQEHADDRDPLQAAGQHINGSKDLPRQA